MAGELNQQPENDYDYWSGYATSFDDDNYYIIGEKTNDEIQAWLVNLFFKDDVVLELGCGTGFTSRWIVDRVKHLTATDMSEDMLEMARARFRDSANVVVRVEDSCQTSFENGTFDVVLAANLIHLVRDPSAIVREAFRVLKNNGRFVVVDYTSHGLSPNEKKNMMRRYFSRWGPIPVHSYAASPDGLKDLVTDAGFYVEESILVGEDSKAVLLLARKTGT